MSTEYIHFTTEQKDAARQPQKRQSADPYRTAEKRSCSRLNGSGDHKRLNRSGGAKQ